MERIKFTTKIYLIRSEKNGADNDRYSMGNKYVSRYKIYSLGGRDSNFPLAVNPISEK